jgi:hypothetical protein
MVQNSLTNYPHARSYVLRLHRDAAPSDGMIMGRLEHVVSGRQYEFHSIEGLAACIVQNEQCGASSGAGDRV